MKLCHIVLIIRSYVHTDVKNAFCEAKPRDLAHFAHDEGDDGFLLHYRKTYESHILPESKQHSMKSRHKRSLSKQIFKQTILPGRSCAPFFLNSKGVFLIDFLSFSL